jgi:uncharacterized protein (DUF1684 family)
MRRRGARTGVAAAALAVALASPAQPAGDAYEAEIQSWRADREARLKADDGWLSVVGLFWLKEGANRFGAAPDNEIVLPAGSAPARAGVLELRGTTTSLRLEPGVVATVKGAPVAALELHADTSGAPEVVRLGRLAFHVIERSGRYGIRLKDSESPRRRTFSGLRWFPVQSSWRIAARFEPYDPPRKVPIANVLGQVNDMTSPGRAVFKAGNKEVSLDAVLEEPDAQELFFIFRDLTTGKTTYGAGRFLYTGLAAAGAVVLDFNKAYSPPCAFTSYATCPLPPPQNRLSVAVEAGEKAPPHP